MAVDRLQTIGVADDDVVAVASTFVGLDTHLPREGCTYRIPVAQLEVRPVVHTPEAMAIAVVRGDLAGGDGHHELLQVDVLAVGDID